jgi:hypothetical protein
MSKSERLAEIPAVNHGNVLEARLQVLKRPAEKMGFLFGIISRIDYTMTKAFNRYLFS